MTSKFCQVNKFNWVSDIAYIHEVMNFYYFCLFCFLFYFVFLFFQCLLHKKVCNLTKLDSKRNLPLLSKATHKNSKHRNKSFLHTGMLQYPVLITFPKACDNLSNKEEIDMHRNLVTESKVTECNRITQKSMSQDEIKKSLSLL